MRLGDAGRPDEGLAPVEEAVGIRRRLAAANPAAYEPDLAASLNNLSTNLADARRGGEGSIRRSSHRRADQTENGRLFC